MRFLGGLAILGALAVGAAQAGGADWVMLKHVRASRHDDLPNFTMRAPRAWDSPESHGRMTGTTIERGRIVRKDGSHMQVETIIGTLPYVTKQALEGYQEVKTHRRRLSKSDVRCVEVPGLQIYAISVAQTAVMLSPWFSIVTVIRPVRTYMIRFESASRPSSSDLQDMMGIARSIR